MAVMDITFYYIWQVVQCFGGSFGNCAILLFLLNQLLQPICRKKSRVNSSLKQRNSIEDNSPLTQPRLKCSVWDQARFLMASYFAHSANFQPYLPEQQIEREKDQHLFSCAAVEHKGLPCTKTCLAMWNKWRSRSQILPIYSSLYSKQQRLQKTADHQIHPRQVLQNKLEVVFNVNYIVRWGFSYFSRLVEGHLTSFRNQPIPAKCVCYCYKKRSQIFRSREHKLKNTSWKIWNLTWMRWSTSSQSSLMALRMVYCASSISSQRCPSWSEFPNRVKMLIQLGQACCTELT